MTRAGLAFLAACACLAVAAGANGDLSPFPTEASEVGPVRHLALRFSDTVDHGRSIRPPRPGESWSSYVAAPFVAKLSNWGIKVDHLPGPDVGPEGRAGRDGTPFDLERDRRRLLAERPRRGARRGEPFDAYLLGDFAHAQKVGLWVTSRYWARYTLLNREGKVVFSRVYPGTLRTLAININRVNREAQLVEADIPRRALADLEPFLKPADGSK